MVEKLLVRLIGDTAGFVKSFSNASRSVNSFATNVHRKVSQVSRSIEGMGRGVESVGNRMSIGLTAPISAFGFAAVRASMEATKLQTSLNILTGSAEEGGAAFKRLQEFSSRTPFQLKDLVQTNNMLLGFGMSTDEAFESVKVLGDASAATGADLNRIAVAFGQSAATGRVMAGDLNQFVNNGIPVYKLLSKETGKNAKELREMASQGELSFDILNKAFIRATKEGGAFFGATEAQAENMEGRLSTLKDNVNALMKSYGDLIEESLKPMIEAAIEIVQRLNNMSDAGKRQILVILRTTAVMGPAVAILGKFLILASKAIPIISGVAAALASWPVIIAVGVAAILGGIFILRDFAGSWENVGKIISNAVDFIVDVIITGFRIVNRSTVVFIGWMGKQFVNLWNADWGGAILKGLSLARNMLEAFSKWAIKKIRAIFTGDEVGSFDNIIAQFQGDLKGGFQGNLLEEFARIGAEELEGLNKRREGKQIIDDATRQRAIDRTQQAIKMGREKSEELLNDVKGHLGRLVELGEDKADEVGLELTPLGLN